MNSELRKNIYNFLMNEKILGKDTVEIDSEILSRLKKNKSRLSNKLTPVNVADRKTAGVIRINTPPNVTKETKVLRGEDSFNDKLSECRKLAKECTKCVLHKTRKNVVFGEGSPDAKLLFIGEAPGAEEDSTGRPFVGQAGKLLTKMIKFLGLERENVYIANIIKCRPPNNRDPLPDEVQNCRNWLDRQIEIINPKLICALGRHSAYFLIGGGHSFSEIRGKLFNYKNAKVLPTFHPAALLYHPAWKVYAVKDFELLKKLYAEH